jgi:hypothetical protein
LHRGLCLGEIRVGTLDNLVGHGVVLDQFAVTRLVLSATRQFSRRGPHFRLVLVDHRRLQDLLCLQLRYGGTGAIHFCRGLRKLGVIVARVQPDQHLVCADVLVVLHEDVRDEAVDLWRHHRHVAADVGIVGRLLEAQDKEPVARSGGKDHRHETIGEAHPWNAPALGSFGRGRGNDRNGC